ncbi:hypothetical protein GW17_00004267 [Ensete ventricosum]|nr:hypothetical protein GW17_00004267 [Ensete ventricosum]RZS26918.1 hypothetical protein BHM03_00060341 [Ensete ventricosum]
MKELSYSQMLGQDQAWVSSYGSDDIVGYSGSSLGVRQEFTEGIGKLARNTPGDRWKKIVRLTARMPEDAGLVGVHVKIRKVEGTTFPKISAVEPRVSGECTTATQVFGWLMTNESLRMVVEPHVPYFQGAFDYYTTGNGG